MDHARERVRKQINNLKFRHVDCKHQLRIAGFKLDDFTRSGLVDVSKLCNLLYLTDSQFMASSNAAKRGVMAPALIGRHTIIHDNLYDRAALDFPMTFSVWTNNVGKSSANMVYTLAAEADGMPLTSTVCRYVQYDLEAKRTAPWTPEQIQHFRSDMRSDGPTFEPFRLPSPPRSSVSVFRCKIGVRYDDVDYNGHTGSSSYVTLMGECAARAAEAGFYSVLHGDIAVYRTVSLSIMHTGQSFAGDELDVTSWEDADNPLQLYFVIDKDGLNISYAKMLYAASNHIRSFL